MKEILNLNFNWEFINDFKEEYLKDYANVEGFKKVNIPHNSVDIPFNYFDEKMIQTVSTYKRDIEIKDEYKDKELNLVFEGVAHAATIYINDDFVTTHKGGYDEFKVDISEFVKYSEKNIVTVLVNSHENENIPPFGSIVDYLGYGGIYREVYLEVADKDKIVDVFVKTNDAVNSITAYCDITVNKTPVIAEVEVFDNKKSVSLNRFNLNREKTTVDFDVKNRELWSLENPKMYDLVVRMYDDNTLLDTYTTRFGFRDVKIEKSGFYLNGKKIKLRGLNRHQSYPYVGYAMPKSVQEKDAEILKYDLGVNIVRTSHYMQSKHFLNKCDDIGLLVLEEIPGWQYIGKEEFKNNTLKNVEAMIRRDKNHPSIILWGVRINESPDCDELYKKTNELAHELDNTRKTCGIRNFQGSKFLEDVFTINDFTHNGSKKVIMKPNKFPYLITENNGHMYPTKSYDNDEVKLNHALRHLRVINESEKNPNILGEIGWCFADYNTHKDFGSGDNICYHGVMDMFRNPKYASYAFASQKDTPYFLEVASSMARGDYQASNLNKVYVFTNCEYIKLFKNDDYVATFYPDTKEFKYLHHPVVIVDDFIGIQLEKRFGFTEKHSNMLKRAFASVREAQGKISLVNMIRLLIIMIKYHMKRQEVVDIFYEYAMGKAGVNQFYRFDGYYNENVVISKTLSETRVLDYKMEIDNKNLEVLETYDATRVVIKAIDQFGITAQYANIPCIIKVSGGIDLIGPSVITLMAGVCAFYVKTNQKGNCGTIEVEIMDKVLKDTINISERIKK